PAASIPLCAGARYDRAVHGLFRHRAAIVLESIPRDDRQPDDRVRCHGAPGGGLIRLEVQLFLYTTRDRRAAAEPLDSLCVANEDGFWRARSGDRVGYLLGPRRWDRPVPLGWHDRVHPGLAVLHCLAGTVEPPISWTVD